MTAGVLTAPDQAAAGRAGDGGNPARRAMVRWAWRLFRHEWRQQLLVLCLVVVAVGATFLGGAVATNTPQPANAAFGTATDLASFQSTGAKATQLGPKMASEIAMIRRRYGPVDLIENQTVAVPGTISSFDLRAQDPHGAFGAPLLSLLSGRYPATAAEVAVTPGVAADFHLSAGASWRVAGQTRRVVGIVQNPHSLLDEFALVLPGQVTAPNQVTVLFDAPGVDPGQIGPNVVTPALVAQSNPLNPVTILLALATLGMLLIGLVAVGGFTVLAQRRMRSIGMIGALGATDKHVRLVVRTNGALVGIVGALLGAVLGFVVWVAYRPTLQTDAHHVVGVFALPWEVILPSMALAVVATYLAATRPARAVTRVPIITALSGRPAPPKEVHRSAIPGALFLVVAFLLMTLSGTGNGNGNGGSQSTPELELVLGFVALTVGIILFAPMFISAFAKLGRRAPIAVRLALRDLARYRSRSSSALAAISLGVMIAAVIAVVATARYSNVLDYVGPNLAPNQMVVYAYVPPQPGSQTITPGGTTGATGTTGNPAPAPSMQAQTATARSIAAAVGGASHMVTLEQTSATLDHPGPGRNFNGQIYVATPQLLALFGISPSEVNPSADFLTMRPGLSTMSGMQAIYGNQGGKGGPPPADEQSSPCPAGSCLANPTIQYLPALPSGTSAPNTLVTEHAVQQLHLQSSTFVAGWFIETPHALAGAQIHDAQQAAIAGQLSIETKSDSPSSAEVIDWATVFGFVLSLGILIMTIGLIRSETASDLRTLTATGASSRTRRLLTGATAGALAFLGAVLGTAAAYIAAVGWFRSNTLNGGLSALGAPPVANLLAMLVVMPLAATVIGWFVAGREPAAIGHQPLE